MLTSRAGLCHTIGMTQRLYPIVIGTRDDNGAPVAVGDLVAYTGRRPGHEYTIFYVADIDDGERGYPGHTLVDRDYPEVDTLYGVHRGNLRPTGRSVQMCPQCGHEAGNDGRRTAGYPFCSYACPCRNHETPRSD